ncbi:hypothetical protein AB0C96_04340 [Streptomyces sp. NPDC048506]|uniref:hypothetical protein n=1 Tax=Streptomyces sp. NPDC048506 TaxID=3155028 RepID=UPI0034329E45
MRPATAPPTAVRPGTVRTDTVTARPPADRLDRPAAHRRTARSIPGSFAAVLSTAGEPAGAAAATNER